MRPAASSGQPMHVTYSIAAPPLTHWRPATCEEVACERQRDGWQISTAALTAQHYADLTAGGWHWTELRISATEAYLAFPAGQRCLAYGSHKVPLERPALYLVRDPARGRRRVHTSAVDWRDDMSEHLARVADDREKG